MMNKAFLALLLTLGLTLTFDRLHAQTYATPEVKAEDEFQMSLNGPDANAIPAAPGAKINEVETPTVNYTPVTIDRPNRKLYKLSDLVIVDDHNQYSPVQMQEYKRKACDEVLENSIVIDWENGAWYISSKDNTRPPVTRSFRVEKTELIFTDDRGGYDESCTIITRKPKSLILHFQPQDESEKFVYQFEFIK